MRALCALAALAGCAPTTAIVDGHRVPRLDLAFTGDPYSVTHRRAHPRPRGPSSGLTGDGGTIAGEVCGMQIDYGVEHRRDHVQLTGFIDGGHPTELVVRDANGARRITGNLGDLGVDLSLTGDHLEGHAGLRVVSLSLESGALVGFLRQPNPAAPGGDKEGVIPAKLDGRDALWGMPPADQAALVPLLLACRAHQAGAPLGDFHAAFGGPPRRVPPGSLALGPDGGYRGPAARASFTQRVNR